MKINGTIFSKPQQDQLKRAIENSGSGTTLNRYVYSVNFTSPTLEIRNRIMNIAQQAKKCFMYASCRVTLTGNESTILTGFISFGDSYYQYGGVLGSIGDGAIASIRIDNNGSSIDKIASVIKNNAIVTISNWNSLNLTITYYNDTEIL